MHGAFTGGFVAGYKNTVGSEMGWTPSNFVSSKNARNTNKKQTVMDYMDHEDLVAIGVSRDGALPG